MMVPIVEIYAINESLKNEKQETKQSNSELFKRVLKNEMEKLQTEEKYK